MATVTLTAAPRGHVAARIDSYRFPLNQPVQDVPDDVVARLPELTELTFVVTAGRTPAPRRKPARKRTTTARKRTTTTEAPS